MFGITKPLPFLTGSGDTTFNYIQIFICICAAIVATAVWSAFDRKHSSYTTLYAVLLVMLRYFLAYTMLSYGIPKVFVNQFSELSLFDLVKTYGDSSPMGLMWNFMEYSNAYTVFSGVAEIVGGLLLLFRQTAKLGALVTFGVMLNVFMLNMSYDIPVKLSSFHLIMMAIFILVPQFRNIINFFILNKPVVVQPLLPYFKKKKWNIAGYALKGIVLVYILSVTTTSAINSQKKWGIKAPKPLLYGIYEVDAFLINDELIPPLTTDTMRWKKLVIEKGESGGIVKMNGDVQYMRHETDPVNTSLKLSSYRQPMDQYRFDYKIQGGDLILEGVFDNCDTLKIELTRKDENDFLLLSRGFHWINEYPLNR